MEPLLLAILVGIFAGICRSVLGFVKNSGDEPFEWGKLLKAVVIMAITGGVVGLFTPNPMMAFAIAFTGGVAIQDLLKSYTNRK